MIELTCPAEEGIDKAHQRKMARYQDLQRRVKDAEWTPILRSIEVGARGYIAKSIHHCLRSLGFNLTLEPTIEHSGQVFTPYLSQSQFDLG